jgi:hypothetical protein
MFKYMFFTVLFASIPYFIYAQNWQQTVNFNKAVNSLYNDTSKNLLFIGGSFKWSDLDTLNGICSWDGQQLIKMGDGLHDACGLNVCPATPMIIWYRNDLFVGSVFKEINGESSNGIAKWDGQDWHPIGDSLNSEDGDAAAWGGCVYDDKLFVVGSFRFAGGDTCNSVAFWDGIQWHGLGFAPNLSFGEVPVNYRCEFYKNNLYVAGNFSYNVTGFFNLNRWAHAHQIAVAVGLVNAAYGCPELPALAQIG